LVNDWLSFAVMALPEGEHLKLYRSDRTLAAPLAAALPFWRRPRQ
jgi:hypothetical protein